MAVHNLFHVHVRYYNMVDSKNGVLKKGRVVFLTGCYLRTAAESAGRPRLLPTEYLVVVLDEVISDQSSYLQMQC